LEDTIKYLKALHQYQDLRREKRKGGGKNFIAAEPPLS